MKTVNENTNQTLKVIFNRISLRKYAEKDISHEDLNAIINAAIRAPTAGNNMLYSIIKIKNKQTKEKLSVSCDNQPFIKNSKIILIFLADIRKLYDYFNLCGVKEFCQKNGIYYTNPNYQMLYLSLNDALIAAQNAVIVAESLGIGSCYIGDIAENYEYHRELLNLPDGVFIATMICFGYYPEGYEKKLRPRFDRKYIVHDEKYSIINSDELKKMYEIYSSQRFESSKGKIAVKIIDEKDGNEKEVEFSNYGQMLYTNKFGSKFSREMERSIRVMLEHWK